MREAIAYPYTIDVTGLVQSTTVANKIYIDRVLTLLSTNVGQRPVNKEYGVDLTTSLFENENNFSKAIQSAITKAVARWLPDIQVADVKVSDIGQDGIGTVEVAVVFPDSTTSSLTLSTATFSSDGTVTA